MDMTQVASLLYLLAAVLFIFTLKMLSSPRTARRGNAIGAIGMLIAIVATLVIEQTVTWTWIIAGLVIGSAIGVFLARWVKMTAMPEMVGFLNGSGGLASALVVIVEFFGAHADGSGGFAAMAGISSLIGWLTFSGSIVAMLKLREMISGRPIVFPLQKVVNSLIILCVLGFIVLLGVAPQHQWMIFPVIAAALVLGVLTVIPIGGADMPVVISVLNSTSGLAAAATGFLIGNPGLIISGALVGASGIILSHLMCVAMNRSLTNVLFGAFGQIATGDAAQIAKRTVRRYSAEDAKIIFDNASSVVIIPGYGLAVAQAQHVCKELAGLLEEKGVKVRYGIHPVAGRMPGHMNVLLAEADVSYSHLLDLDQSNAELETADVSLIIGGNDVVNPIARTDKNSPIYGMPILNADHAQTVMIIKRSLSPGFAGIDNPLFYEEKTMMLFGDAKKMLTDIVAAVKAG